MGAQNQPPKTQTKTSNHQQYPIPNHSKFTYAEVINSKDQNLYFEVPQSIANLSTYTQWQQKLKELKNKIGPQSLYLPIQCEYKQQGFCGSSGTLKFKFQYFAYLLDEEIINRQSQNQPFQEKQLWFLLYILTQTASQLHKANFLVGKQLFYQGDIHPKNIFINHSGDISVYSMHSFPQDFTNFQKVLYFKESNYLPPEGVNDIQTGKQLPSYDQKIGQSFSVGLTILNAIFLTDFSFLYDKMERFNEIAFYKIIATLKEYQISENLKKIICALLQINPEKRLTCIQLWQYLSPYQKQIFELEDFQIQSQVPQKNRDKEQIKQQEKDKRNEIESSQIKVTDKFQISQKRLSSNKTISLHGSSKKKSPERNFNSSSKSNEATKCKNQNAQQQNNPTQKILPFFSNQPSSPTIQSYEKPSQQKTNPHYPQYQLNKQFTNIKIENNNILDKSHEKIGQAKKEADQQNKIPKMIFKTGDLFQRQKSSASLLLIENSYPSSLNANLVESRKVKYPANSYQNHEGSNIFNLNENRQSPISISSNDQYNDFLKSIQKQIEESRKMFPDSMK